MADARITLAIVLDRMVRGADDPVELLRAAQSLRRLGMLVQALTLRLHPGSEPVLIDAWLEFLSDAGRGVVRRNSVREHFHERSACSRCA